MAGVTGLARQTGYQQMTDDIEDRMTPGRSSRQFDKLGQRASDLLTRPATASQLLPGAGPYAPRASDFLPGGPGRATDLLPASSPGGYISGYDGYSADWWLPAQQPPADGSLDTEWDVLSREQPPAASRVARLPLTHGERDMVSYALREADKFAASARAWQLRGNRLYTGQIIAAAMVPVLIALIGNFGSDGADQLLQICAIGLSICGTLCGAVESVYAFRARGQVRYNHAERMHNLFNSYATLSGALFDPNCADPADSSTEVFIPDISAIPRAMLRAHLLHLDELDARQEGQAIARAGRHSGQNFKVFCAAFNRLQDQCRQAAYVDVPGVRQGRVGAFDAATGGAYDTQGRARVAVPLSGARWDARMPRAF